MRTRMIAFVVALIGGTVAAGQTNTATTFLSGVLAKYPALGTIHFVRETGTMTWGSGPSSKTGSFIFEAGTDGSSTLHVNLPTVSRSETRGVFAVPRSCIWTDNNGGTHLDRGQECEQAVPWFAPLLFAEPAANVSNVVTIADDGEITQDGATLHKITYTTPLPATPSTDARVVDAPTQVSVFYNPQTLLPASVEYLERDNANHGADLKMRVVYSDYQTLAGLPVPHKITRYAGGNLQSSLLISNASVK